MSSFKAHCSLSYHELPLDLVEPFATGVKTGYFGNNPPFTVQPFTQADLELKITTYVNTRAAYINGGESQKGAFLLAKADLMLALDTLNRETDIVADGNVGIIELAGYEPTKVGIGEGNKPGQCVVTIKRGIAGELISSCAKVEGAKHYGCIMTEGAPLPEGLSINGDGRLIWQEGVTPVPPPPPAPQIVSFQIDFTDQREKHFLGLKHDVTYYFYYYAVNATGVGPLSEVEDMVCW